MKPKPSASASDCRLSIPGIGNSIFWIAVIV
jgi:hypothetical protein